MWKSAFLVLFFLALGVQSNVDTQYQEEVPGHEGECMGKDQKFYKLGETIADGEVPCGRKVCKGTAAPGSVYLKVEKCTKVEKQPGCELKSDTQKNFPECCARLECKHH